MPETETIRARYDVNARRYADFVADPANDHPLPTAMITAFAATARGRVLDAGCGPGQWTAFLHEHGLDAEGVDLSPEALAIARHAYPNLPFATGSLLDLAADDASYGGVLAHFSLIHTPPDDVPLAVRELARVLAPGGVLLLAGFADLETEAPWVEYDHKICPAFQWSPGALAAVVRAAGFAETGRLLMPPPPGSRSAAVYLMATRT